MTRLFSGLGIHKFCQSFKSFFSVKRKKVLLFSEPANRDEGFSFTAISPWVYSPQNSGFTHPANIYPDFTHEQPLTWNFFKLCTRRKKRNFSAVFYSLSFMKQLSIYFSAQKTFTCWFIHLNFCLIDKHKQKGEKVFFSFVTISTQQTIDCNKQLWKAIFSLFTIFRFACLHECLSSRICCEGLQRFGIDVNAFFSGKPIPVEFWNKNQHLKVVSLTLAIMDQCLKVFRLEILIVKKFVFLTFRQQF